MPEDPFHLHRFLDAQAATIDTALAELQAGRKRTHWMWFIFPQLRGLGHSPTAQLYGIASAGEATAYTAHPLLGDRLQACTRAALRAPASTLPELFDTPDDTKFRSSMTLFNAVPGPQARLCAQALARWCDGRPDRRTLALLADPATRQEG